MKGLVLNHLYTVEKGIRSSILMTIVGVILLLVTQHSIAIRMAAFLPFILIPVNALEGLKLDIKSGWNKFEITLPVTRKQIVQSKYVTFLILFGVSVLITFVLFYLAHLLVFPTFTVVFFNFLLRGMGLILCMAALTIPLTYLLSIEKADSITMFGMGFGLGMFFLVLLALPIIKGISDGFDEIFSVTFFTIAVLLFMVSYVVSRVIYIKKEF